MEYFTFDKRKEYLVCIDSDGCAMDTMDVKHENCFGPQWIRTFGLEEYEKECMEYWRLINLHSMTRGINRFKGLAMACKEMERRGYLKVEGLEEFVSWTEQAKELSNLALLELTQKTENECVEKALLWSIRTNRKISALPPDDKPFMHVKSTMDVMCQNADLVAVSSANREAVVHEWTKHELAQACRELLCQEAGSKAYCIGELCKKGYEKANVIMVGDAPGDLAAARKNGVWFFPILVGKEGDSWMKLQKEAFPRLLQGNFNEAYQEELVREFEENLSK